MGTLVYRLMNKWRALKLSGLVLLLAADMCCNSGGGSVSVLVFMGVDPRSDISGKAVSVNAY
ncbi:hypothetical protein EJ110_NYTH40628 [Nymphaea thermarum]|nr:hypothetical protein EJ110_NYTH40628 [Nymphaea thermarum]